jgi:four helix bundle protein
MPFEDLEVWKKSCRLTVDLYGLIKNSRDFGIKDQMIRSALSIPSNIAEGCERKSIPEFKRFINIAKGSAAELRTQVYIAKEIKMLGRKEAFDLLNELKSISKMLQGLHNSLEKQLTTSNTKKKSDNR